MKGSLMNSTFDSRRNALKFLGSATALAAFPVVHAQANEIKIGVLHSLTGTMAISETLLKDTVLMAVDEINRSGGVLGRMLKPVIVDPRSDWPAYAQGAEKLYTEEKVAVIFGCWTSVSRKTVLPVLDKTGGLLFYPVQYEGQEQHKRVFYTGCAPNQQAMPAIDYLISKDGGSNKRFYLHGTDYVYPRTTNRILTAYLQKHGINKEDIKESYTPFGHNDFSSVLAEAQNFAKGAKTALVSTINGDANLFFYRDVARLGISPEKLPIMAFSVGEEELRDVDTASIAGHYAAWTYFMNNKNPMNTDFIGKWSAYAKAKNIPRHNIKPIVNDPMQATWIGIFLWKMAVENTRSIDPDKVTEAMKGLIMPAPSGGWAKMDEENHHLYQTPMVGRIRPDGQFDVVWKAKGIVRGLPFAT
jgi:urea transport system substrate-binding protein